MGNHVLSRRSAPHFSRQREAETIEEIYIETERNLSSRPAKGNELRYIEQVLRGGNLSALMGGTVTPKFEEAFSALLGSKYSVAMNSCMSVLHSAVIAAEAGPGSEVICDSVYVFGAMSVLYNGAIPVFVDVNPTTHNVDPDKLEAAITQRTKAIIVTHAWGLPAEMDRITAIAKKHGLLVIEDCAESLLAKYDGKYTGVWGDVGCFSFQASKQMSLGDAGMATVQDEELHKQIANFALAPTFLSVAYTLDYNYRINELTAAAGLALLERVEEEMAQIAAKAALLDAAVEGCPWITLQRGPEKAEHSFYYWAGNLLDDGDGPTLEQFSKAVEEAGMETVSVGYTKMAAYQHPLIRHRRAAAFTDPRNADCVMRFDDGCCPVAERIVPRTVLGYTIAPEEVVRRDADKLAEVIRKLS